MFGKIRELLERLILQNAGLAEDVDDVGEMVHETRDKVDSLTTWIELLADTKADDVAYEFSKLLDAHTKAGHKITNVALQQLVHQAVLNTKK